MKKVIIVGIILVAILGGYLYFKNKNQTPKVEIGEQVSDLGRDHVDDIFGINYNSNPPTSGPHFPVWAKPGLYTQLNSDGYYIHSMEHGYIILWYNCDRLSASSFKFVSEVLAHGEEPLTTSNPKATIEPLMHMEQPKTAGINWITPDTQPQPEVGLPMSFQTPGCADFINELKPFLKSAQRVIIAPRVAMDKKLVITAWGRILNLDSVESEKINEFIKTYHNKGPEQTIE